MSIRMKDPSYRWHPESERDQWYYHFIKSDKTMNYEFYYDSNTGVLFLYHNRKLFAPSGDYLGVLGIRIKYKNLIHYLKMGEKDELEAYFINDDGEIIIHPDQTKLGSLEIYDFFGLLQDTDESAPEEEKTKKSVQTADGFLFSYDNFPGDLVVKIRNKDNFFTRHSFSELLLAYLVLVLLCCLVFLMVFRVTHQKKEEKTE